MSGIAIAEYLINFTNNLPGPTSRTNVGLVVNRIFILARDTINHPIDETTTIKRVGDYVFEDKYDNSEIFDTDYVVSSKKIFDYRFSFACGDKSIMDISYEEIIPEYPGEVIRHIVNNNEYDFIGYNRYQILYDGISILELLHYRDDKSSYKYIINLAQQNIKIGIDPNKSLGSIMKKLRSEYTDDEEFFEALCEYRPYYPKSARK